MVTDGLITCHDPANTKSYPGTGTIIYDLSGNGNNGSGIPTLTQENLGVLTYNGTSQYTQFANGVTGCTDPFSISTWVRIPTAATWTNGYSGTVIANAGGYSGTYGIVRTASDNQIGLYVRGQTGSTGTYTYITRDTWYNIQAVWNGTIAFLYVNGVKTGQEGATLTGNWDSTAMYYARARAFGGAYGNYYGGDLGITMYYNKAISASEALQNFNATKERYI